MVSFKDFLVKSKFNVQKARLYQESYDKIMHSGLFDKKYYLKTYPHIKKSGMDPLVHYLFYGYKENKLPSPSFNLKRYLQEFPEVESKKLNPLIHYIDNGHSGFTIDENPFVLRKEKILDTNKLFLSNYTFDSEPLVSIIILNRNGLGHLQRLFEDFDSKTNYSNYEIIVVDNASRDESVEYLHSLDLNINVIENSENVSFSKGNNDAAKIANGEYLLLLNNDIEPTYGWLNELVGCMLKNDNVGSVGAKLIFPYYDDIENQGKSYTIQHAGVKFREERTPYIYGPYHEHMYSTLLFSDEVNHEKEVISNTAACLLVKKDVYLDLGGLDENYFYGYEDIDFAFKLYKSGYKSIYNPFALLFHHESATRIEDEDKKNQLNYKNIMYFLNKWEDFIFKEIFKDKLNHDMFITNKKLDISIVSKNDDFISGIARNFNEKGYNVKLIPDINNLEIGEDCDILISNDKDYNIDKAISRLNLIKVLICENDDERYDICLDVKENYADELLNLINRKYL
ncbi:glycosyltransferase family 2 protein [Methanobrevibacter sp.]|uniref:glycosyltransferase family 2 protein n=1 Tax=Methanobrevibacter sp. TaxID=66852 RepID=UPI003890320F